jgi:hypothetical protein
MDARLPSPHGEPSPGAGQNSDILTDLHIHTCTCTLSECQNPARPLGCLALVAAAADADREAGITRPRSAATHGRRPGPGGVPKGAADFARPTPTSSIPGQDSDILTSAADGCGERLSACGGAKKRSGRLPGSRAPQPTTERWSRGLRGLVRGRVFERRGRPATGDGWRVLTLAWASFINTFDSCAATPTLSTSG